MARRTGNFEHYESGRTGQQLRDPYIPQKGYEEHTLCPVCNAIYHKKRWVFDPKLLKELKKNKDFITHICPADKKIKDKYAMGKVYLSGAFIDEHTDEIIKVIKNEEKKAKENNPLDRLISLQKQDGSIYAETTSDALAMRIGHHLKKSYKGSSEEFKFRQGDKFVEIRWTR
jgi:hypothetical protein